MSDFSAMMDSLIASSEGAGRIEIDIPEWANTPCKGKLYSAPYTIKDDIKLGRYIRNDDSSGFVEVLIQKAELADGSKAFGLIDKPQLLRRVPAHIIKRIAMQIVASVPTVEDAEGN